MKQNIDKGKLNIITIFIGVILSSLRVFLINERIDSYGILWQLYHKPELKKELLTYRCSILLILLYYVDIVNVENFSILLWK